MFLNLKIGFIGAGNLSQSMIKGLLKNPSISPSKIFASNRTPGKLAKLKEQFNINICDTNEDLVESADIIILAVKPQDLIQVVEPIHYCFTKEKIVVSVAAGVSLDTLGRYITESRLIRAMPNTPSLIGRGVIGYCVDRHADEGSAAVVEELLANFGYVVRVDEGDEFDAVMISSSCGTGFVFELMNYWQEWIEEHGLPPAVAKKMTIETFLGAAELAKFQNDNSFDELLTKVASKKGVTEAGLDSMRSTEIERSLRISFEKSGLRNQDILRETQSRTSKK